MGGRKRGVPPGKKERKGGTLPTRPKSNYCDAIKAMNARERPDVQSFLRGNGAWRGKKGGRRSGKGKKGIGNRRYNAKRATGKTGKKSDRAKGSTAAIARAEER